MRTHIRFTEQLSVEKLVPGYVERRVSWVLGRFAHRIGTVTVKLSGRGPDAVRPLTCRMSADVQPPQRLQIQRLNNRATIRGQAA